MPLFGFIFKIRIGAKHVASELRKEDTTVEQGALPDAGTGKTEMIHFFRRSPVSANQPKTKKNRFSPNKKPGFQKESGSL
ncbi:MAG: hypothetical protein GY820_44390 [Gammaproteobacteria bacterium]|nr:hypothetical protein [Gammaproteobacteria bacterium]